jgi:serine phosphatase RsbU (regulator of sigma subunit)
MGSTVRLPGAGRLGVLRPALVAAVAGLVAFGFGTSAESVIVRAVHGDRPELEWISDVVIASGVVALTYLWLNLRESRMHLLAAERQQIAMDEQLLVAARIQRSLLPDVPAATPGFRWAAGMVPAGRVGGDFYDFLQPRRGVVLAIVADVSGKGIPAALVLSSLKTLFRAIVRETREPSSIAQRLSDALFETHQGAPYVTAIILRLESDPPRLEYVNAGHPPGRLLRGAEVLRLGPYGRPLGLLPDSRFVAESVELAEGDVGVFFTDGISEALESGPATLDGVLARTCASRAALRQGEACAPAALCDALLRAAAAGGGPPGVDGWQDDRTVLALAVHA